MTSFLIYNHHC